MANAAIYVPKSRFGATARILGGRSDEGFFRSPTFLEWTIGVDAVRLNVMSREEVTDHVQGFCRWIDQLAEPDACKIEAKRRVAWMVS